MNRALRVCVRERCGRLGVVDGRSMGDALEERETRVLRSVAMVVVGNRSQWQQRE